MNKKEQREGLEEIAFAYSLGFLDCYCQQKKLRNRDFVWKIIQKKAQKSFEKTFNKQAVIKKAAEKIERSETTK